MKAEQIGRLVGEVIRDNVRPEALRGHADTVTDSGPSKRVPLSFTIRKFAGSGKRTFSGIASTDSIDRAGDTLNPRGAVYRLPVPLLLQHDATKPIGWVRGATVTSRGIEVDCEIAEGIGEADEAWKMVKSGLVSGLSVGFLPLEAKPTATGLHFERWDWHELSLVTIACNADAKVTAKAGKGSVRLMTLPAGSIKLLR